MKAWIRPALLLSALSLLWAMPAHAQDGARYNPFKRLAGPTVAKPKGSITHQHRVDHPRLRGVLQAQDGSLANLDGNILVQGESALGYTLVAVHNHSATFRFRQQLITLQVTEDRP